MYIKDLQSGEVRKYGTNPHDALRVSRDGTILSYENLQNGDGSRFGDYRFCDEDGLIPEDDEVLVKYGADAYFNIGGFVEKVMYQDAERKKGEWTIKEANLLFGMCVVNAEEWSFIRHHFMITVQTAVLI